MKRLLTGILAATAWVFLLLAGPIPLFNLAVAGLTALALAEFLTMVLPETSLRLRLAVTLFGMLPLLGASSGRADLLLAGLMAALLCLLFLTVLGYASLDDPFALASRCGFGLLYIAASSAYLLLLATLPQGRHWLLLLTTITAASDTAAYYTGTLLGRHKLHPAISPGKTWEGFAGGLTGGLLAALVVASFFLPETGPAGIGLLAILIGCVGALGDLVESVVKRAFGIKDSGCILPGHGGLLDRIDSLLLAAPVLYYLLSFMIPSW
ncbi:MAG: phosphatidate cytidylyltransferase [Thermodesulfobacteriota bacterium]